MRIIICDISPVCLSFKNMIFSTGAPKPQRESEGHTVDRLCTRLQKVQPEKNCRRYPDRLDAHDCTGEALKSQCVNALNGEIRHKYTKIPGNFFSPRYFFDEFSIFICSGSGYSLIVLSCPLPKTPGSHRGFFITTVHRSPSGRNRIRFS